jgi:glycosyltransferase involved in cell wall biosynthesis
MEDRMKLLALVESPHHVCYRYRIRGFAAAVEDAGWSLHAQGLERSAIGRVLQLRRADQFDSVVLQRRLLPSWQLTILRRAARRLVFDFDDAVLFRDSYDARGRESAWRYRRFAATVRLVDTVIAGNDFLADCALRAGAKPERVHVIPTCVDPNRYPLASHERSADSIELVWIGSSSTLKGLEASTAIWTQLAAAIPELKIRLICDRFPDRFPIPVVRVPWSEETEGRELAAGQIGVSWLPDDVWSRGKCGLKLLQYQAAGLPAIANPVGCQTEMIKNGETGSLATTPEEWVMAARLLAANDRLRRRMGQRARERVEADYSYAAWAETFVNAIGGPARAGELEAATRTRVGSRDRRRHVGAKGGRVGLARTLNQIGDR